MIQVYIYITQACVSFSSIHRGGVQQVCIWSNGEERHWETHLSKWDHIHWRVARGHGIFHFSDVCDCHQDGGILSVVSHACSVSPSVLLPDAGQGDPAASLWSSIWRRIQRQHVPRHRNIHLPGWLYLQRPFSQEQVKSSAVLATYCVLPLMVKPKRSFHMIKL